MNSFTRYPMPARLALSCVAVLLATFPSSPLSAQENVATKKMYVAFNMPKWKSKHIHDETAAGKFSDTLKTLGCDVKTANHNGHMDVSCRTQTWKALALDSQEQVKQWTKWLQDAGFQTIHGYRVESQTRKDGAHKEVVQYRLPEWKASHIHEKKQVLDLTALYQGLGCELVSSSHGGHTDLKVRCQEWMEFDVGSHEIAHTWQKYLGSLGFETKHEH